MPLHKSSLNLLADFPPSSYQEWRTAAEKLLKGAPFDEKLTTSLLDGITTLPIYMHDSETSARLSIDMFPGFGSLRRGTNADGGSGRRWSVAQEFAIASPDELNAVLRSESDRGLDSVHIVPDFAARLGGLPFDGRPTESGVPIRSLHDFEAILSGIDIERIQLAVQAGASALPLLAFLTALAYRRGLNLASIRGSIISDPLGTLVQAGSLPIPTDSLYDDMRLSVDWADEVMPAVNVIGVDGSCYHNGGALSVEELGFALATGAEYLRELARRSCPVDRAAKRFLFSFSIGPDFFLEIAKLRAVRLLWSSVVAAFGGGAESRKMRVHCRTSSFFAARFDPYVNMLRGTTEALSGALGGCDSLHVSSFDECFQNPDEFSRRIARNTQIILHDEAHVDQVIDPAGGSWFVEWLTDAMADQAWKVFQTIEAAGGMTQSLVKGLPQQMVARSLDRRTEGVASKRTRVVGVNAYPNLKETTPGGRPDAGPQTTPDASGRNGSFSRSSPQAERPHSRTELDMQLQSPTAVMDAMARAAMAGATLDELFGSLHPSSSAPVSAVPIPASRLVEEFEDARSAGQESETKREAQR
jgi:methylmalonyl-CoA mutase